MGLLVAVVLPTGLAAWSMSAWFTSQDAGRFDRVEARLAGGRESYAAASDRVRALASQDEGTSRVALTSTLTCRTTRTPVKTGSSSSRPAAVGGTRDVR